jgi:hypothetical protein
MSGLVPPLSSNPANINHARSSRAATQRQFDDPKKPRINAAIFVLAEDVGAGERSVRTYLKELETIGLLEIKQRGLGKTNIYRLFLTVERSAGHRADCLHPMSPDQQ